MPKFKTFFSHTKYYFLCLYILHTFSIMSITWLLINFWQDKIPKIKTYKSIFLCFAIPSEISWLVGGFCPSWSTVRQWITVGNHGWAKVAWLGASRKEKKKQEEAGHGKRGQERGKQERGEKGGVLEERRGKESRGEEGKNN